MPNTLNAVPPQIHILMNRGGRQEKQLLLTKTGGDKLTGYRGQLVALDNEGAWIQMNPTSFALALTHPHCVPVTLTVDVPTDAKYGEHSFAVQFVAEDQANDSAEVELIIRLEDPWQKWLRQHVWWVVAFAVLAIVIIILLAFWR